MNRPSQQIDTLLIASGIALLPETGCSGLSVRKLVEHAGVNLGMFHYHFKNKDNFIRIVLQRLYEDMFEELELQADGPGDAVAKLRAAILVVGAFARTHRKMLLMLVSEAMRGEALALLFLRDNLPRHIGVVARLVRQGQLDGSIVDLPVPHLLPFIIGAVAGPLLAGGAVEQQASLPAPMAAMANVALLSEEALAMRIDLALRGIAAPSAKEV